MYIAAIYVAPASAMTIRYHRQTHDGSGRRPVGPAAPRSIRTFVADGFSNVAAARSARCVCAGADAAVRSTGTVKLALCRPSIDSMIRRHDAAAEVGSQSNGTSNAD